MKYIFSQSLHEFKTMNESIVILSSYQFTAVALTQKLLDGLPLSPFSFAQVGQVKCRPKKKVILKVSHSVVAEGTVCVCVWGGGGEGCKGRQA